MKQNFSRTIVACGVSLLALSFSVDLRAEAKSVTAKVRAIHGTAQISIDGGNFTALKVNDTVRPGSVIRTGVDSTVDVFLNQSSIRISPETTIGLEKLVVTDTGADKVSETQLSLKAGNIVGNVKKLSAASKYEIKSPTGVAGIRGTDFQVKVIPLGAGKYKFLVTSIQGTVVGSAVNQQNNLVTAVINTGETWDPDEGTSLLPPELLNALTKIVEDLNSGAIPQPTESSPPLIVHVEEDNGSSTDVGSSPDGP
jgi:hypothetical protein